MKKHLLLLLLGSFPLILPGVLVAQNAGETDFKQVCAACHSIGRGRLVGPDLANVTERRSEDWLLKFIKSSSSVINSGDKAADSLFQAYNKTVMPDQPGLDDTKIRDILAYIKTSSPGSVMAGGSTGTAQPGNTGVAPPKEKLFSRINITLLAVILILLGVLFHIFRINKNLTDQIRDFYSSDRAFLRKKK